MCHSKLKLQRVALGHVPVQNPQLPLLQIFWLTDLFLTPRSLYITMAGHTPTQKQSWTHHGEGSACYCLTRISAQGWRQRGHGEPFQAFAFTKITTKENSWPFLSAKQTLLAPGYTCVRVVLRAVLRASFMQCSNSPSLHHLTFIRSLSSKCAQPLHESLPADRCDLCISRCTVGGINDRLHGTISHTETSAKLWFIKALTAECQQMELN